MERKLFRSRKNRLFLGVCAGLGEYYRIDPVAVRVIMVLITVVSSFIPGIIAYFILALIIPLQGSNASTTQETFHENLADLEHSSKHIGDQFKRSPSSAAEPAPPEAGISFPAPTRSNRVIYFIAIALVAIGIFFLILKSIPGIWQILWPLTLIVAGVIIIVLVFTRKKPT